MTRKRDYLTNKGVTAKVEVNNASCLCTSTISSSSSVLWCEKNLSKVKKDVRTVIELMGPSTPNFNKSTSNMADNEESVFSAESVSAVNREDFSVSEDCVCTDHTTPPDITLQEETDVSRIADLNSTAQELATNDTHHPSVVCPPPWFPANAVFGSECMCPQVANYMQTLANQAEQGVDDLPVICKACQYKIQNYDPNHDRMVARENIPCKDTGNFNEFLIAKDAGADNVDGNERHVEDVIDDERYLNERAGTTTLTKVDVYYFDHGNYRYLQTTDTPPQIHADAIAEKTEAYTTAFWAEVFGSIHVGVSFFTSFILQLLRFMLHSIMRPLTIGIFQLGSDYFFKPLLATFFNGLIQPITTLFFNVFVSLKDISRPLATGIGYFIREIAVFVEAFRIVDVQQQSCLEVQSKREDKKLDKRNKV